MTNIIPESWAEKIISGKIKEWEEKRKKGSKIEKRQLHSLKYLWKAQRTWYVK